LVCVASIGAIDFVALLFLLGFFGLVAEFALRDTVLDPATLFGVCDVGPVVFFGMFRCGFGFGGGTAGVVMGRAGVVGAGMVMRGAVGGGHLGFS